MKRFYTMPDEPDSQERQMRINYPFLSINIQPWLLLRNPTFKPTEQVKPSAWAIKQRPIYESKIIRYNISTEKKEKPSVKKKKKPASQKLPVLNLSVVKAVRQGKRLFIDLNTKRTFMAWRTRQEQQPVSQASQLNEEIIQQDMEAMEVVQKSKKRLQQIRESLSPKSKAFEVRPQVSDSRFRRSQRVKSVPDQRLKQSQRKLLYNSKIKDPVLIELLSNDFRQIRRRVSNLHKP